MKFSLFCLASESFQKKNQLIFFFSLSLYFTLDIIKVKLESLLMFSLTKSVAKFFFPLSIEYISHYNVFFSWIGSANKKKSSLRTVCLPFYFYSYFLYFPLLLFGNVYRIYKIEFVDCRTFVYANEMNSLSPLIQIQRVVK